MKVIYPAIVREIGHENYVVEFPDLPECIVEGTSVGECQKEAEYMLGAYICALAESHNDIPQPSELTDIEVPSDGYATYIEADPIYHSTAYKLRKIKARRLKLALCLVGATTITAAAGAVVGYRYYKKHKA